MRWIREAMTVRRRGDFSDDIDVGHLVVTFLLGFTCIGIAVYVAVQGDHLPALILVGGGVVLTLLGLGWRYAVGRDSR